MQAIELVEGESFFINEKEYKALIFKVLYKDDEKQMIGAEIDMWGLPKLQREFGYGMNVLRVHDVNEVTKTKDK